MRRWIPAVLIAANYLFAGITYHHLPAQVHLQWGELVPWIPSADAEAMPRLFAAFMMPTIALCVWLLFVVGASPMGERFGRRLFPRWLLSDQTGAAAIERFEPTFQVIVSAVVGFLVLLDVVTTGTALGWPVWTVRTFTVIIGLGMISLGNIMPRTRPNWIAGVRTRRTLSDAGLWRRTHRYFGALLMVSGLAVIAVSVVAGRYALVTAAFGMVVSAATAAIVAQWGTPTSSDSKGGISALVTVLAVVVARL